MPIAKRVKELKSVQMSFRLSERCRAILVELSEREDRSLSNILERAVFAYAEAAGIEVPKPKLVSGKGKSTRSK